MDFILDLFNVFFDGRDTFPGSFCNKIQGEGLGLCDGLVQSFRAADYHILFFDIFFHDIFD